MKKIFHLIILLSVATGWAQKPVFTTARAKAATVYFNAAELLQSASANLPAGTSEVVIKNVANSLNENTIQIGTPASVTVLSVQFTTNYMSEYEIDESSPLIKKVRDSMALVKRQIVLIDIDKNSHNKTIELLDKNQQIAGANAMLNVAELMKLADYYQAKRNNLSNALFVLQEKQDKLNQTYNKLSTKLEINANKEEKLSTGKLVLQVMNDAAGNIPFDISYITHTATWKPFYDLRTESIASPVNMMYKAQITQNTGVDWKKVKLTLSSGMPNQNNQAPLLQAWFLNYVYPNTAYKYYEKEEAKLNEVVVTSQAYSRNDRASVSNYTTITENQLNVSFDIDIPYDILSNGKAHSVALKEIKLPATYKYYAAPRAEKEAFLLAGISDYSKYNLLPGEANIIFEGMYVGKTVINPNQTSDTLNLSLGRDKKISIKREKVAEKSGTKFLSAFKEQSFTYDITIRNNKKEAIEMLLKDQYPLSTDKDITVELLQSDKAKINPETGILAWELKLDPNETRKIRISYKVRYPKDKNINNL